MTEADEIEALKKERIALKARVKDLEQRLVCIAAACVNPIFDIWQVAPVGSDTEIGQKYIAVDRAQSSQSPPSSAE